MLIAKLTISYDRGLARNEERDLGTQGVLSKGARTEDGKIIRGLGTHFRTETDQQLVKERDRAAAEVREGFRNRFLATPLDGVYVVPAPGIAKAYAGSLVTRSDIAIRVTEFKLESTGELDNLELIEWATRIKNQLTSVSLGRTKEADEEGLRALETLSQCPVLKKETGTRVRELVSMVRDNRLSRVELKRSLEKLDVHIEQAPLAPRRTPALV